jgi:hypothetical protein
MYKTALEQSDLFKHGTGVVFLINLLKTILARKVLKFAESNNPQ